MAAKSAGRGDGRPPLRRASIARFDGVHFLTLSTALPARFFVLPLA
jgi:hypothetical protein